MVSLLLGGAFVLVGRLHSTPSDSLDHPADPINDDQARAQVVESARQLVIVTGLHTTSAGYSLLSCTNRYDPPYQGAIYLTFAIPADTRAYNYVPAIASVLVAHGWIEGRPVDNRAFGKTFTKDAVTAILYPRDEDPGLGVVRLYGQCRNMNDHRNDTTAWIDITDQFTKTG